MTAAPWSRELGLVDRSPPSAQEMAEVAVDQLGNSMAQRIERNQSLDAAASAAWDELAARATEKEAIAESFRAVGPGDDEKLPLNGSGLIRWDSAISEAIDQHEALDLAEREDE